MGLSYFKGLNAGIEALTELVRLMKVDSATYMKSTMNGLKNCKKTKKLLFSKYRIRLGGIVQSINKLIAVSGSSVTDKLAELENTTRAFANKHNIPVSTIYPHQVIAPQHDQLDSPDSPIRAIEN